MSLCKLPSSTVKLISSAQVITSVSSVVKELIENSLDAGATNIEVKLENHGLDRIEVKDNGKGINREDVWHMCKKSYTSKISDFEDLNRLNTYGFRGEALNSLCAVSKVSITTITEKDSIAMTYEFDNNGCISGSKMSHVIKGTSVVVENLFKNLPVRKQFLSSGKRKGDEIRKVEQTVKSLAIIHPKLRIVFTHNKFCIWQKNAVPNVRLSLIQAVAPTIVKQLVDIRQTVDQVSFLLLIPAKGCNISSTCYGNQGDAVYLFINKRPVKDRNIEKIIQEEIFNFFGHEIPSGKYPTCLVSIVLPPDALDVNLEPNKTRVIIKDMDEIGSILKRQLTEYYIGGLGPPKDFLDAIDEEVAKTTEKRKLEEDVVEVKLKIPKIKSEKEENIKSEKPEATIDSSIELPKSPDKSFLPETTSAIKSPVNDDREKTVAEFLDGLIDDKTGKSNQINKEDDINCSLNDVTMNGNYFEDSGISEASTTPELKNDNDSSACPPLDINSFTLSQWSRGDIRLKGSTIQSSTTIAQVTDKLNEEDSNKQLINTNSLHKSSCDEEKEEDKSSQIVNVDPLTKMETSINETQTSERSVSSQMGCKDMAGFTKYASEMTEKIVSGSSGMTFGKVASELASRWRELHDSEREAYNQKSKSKHKERENKANASMRDRLQKFLSKSNENKLLKKRNYCKTVAIDMSLGSLRKAFERRISQKKEDEICYTGQLTEDLKCAVNGERDLYIFSERRLAEALYFYNNLGTMIVPVKVLESNIIVNEENLGESLWPVLISMETSLDVRVGIIIISDSRITSNGLRIELIKDSPGSCHFEITDVPLHVAFFGLEDLKEILRLIEGSSDLPLEECRPLKIISYIRAETIRHISKNELSVVGGNTIDKFKNWLSTIEPKIKRCPHQNQVFKKINLNDFLKVS